MGEMTDDQLDSDARVEASYQPPRTLRAALSALIAEADRNAVEHAIWWATGREGPYIFQMSALQAAKALLDKGRMQ